ncbi:hypothetical protein P4I85_14410 [Bacillus cereus]|uniref:hypothetical protein n=1 Tax=Bacillus thuringiensis TaxID=1428 RepID=UPI001298E43A|nr:hypothetical protein [Bacillus thuringiensis]MEB9509587.1 hypothetical protein [Bacillus cereus]MEB9561679.1 hypothetical protein [Bacillus cereus]MRC02998.1 hypothetical protein [Bacillus thuringiensis]
MFKLWECVGLIRYDRTLNRHYGCMQWAIQECLAILFIRMFEILEGREFDIHARVEL